jgi:hypothetical protein
VLHVQKVRSGFPLFHKDQLVAAGHEEAITLPTVLDDQLPATTEKVFA